MSESWSTKEWLGLSVALGLVVGGIVIVGALTHRTHVCTKWGEPRKVTICEGDSRVRTVCRDSLEGVCLEYDNGDAR